MSENKQVRLPAATTAIGADIASIKRQLSTSHHHQW